MIHFRRAEWGQNGEIMGSVISITNGVNKNYCSS